MINTLVAKLQLTQKLADFRLFKQVIELKKKKTHLTIEGLYQIINIKASMNLGLSDMLKFEFKNFIPIERPIINTEIIPVAAQLIGLQVLFQVMEILMLILLNQHIKLDIGLN